MNWKKVLENMKSKTLKKEDSDRNTKIEAALNAQGRKTTIPQEAHEALHSWWQSSGKSSLLPAQQNRLNEIKQIKERRSNFKVVKTDELQEIKKSLQYLREAIQSPLFKAKMARSEWSPSREYSPKEHEALKPHLDAGHSMQEAAHLSGVDRTAANHGNQIPSLSPIMMDRARAAAKDWIGRSRQRDASEAQAAINPEKYMSGKSAEIHSSKTAVTKSYADALKEHKTSVQHLSPEEQISSIQKFKSDFHASPMAKLSHIDAAKTHSDIAHEAKDARSKELYESRKNILLGGQGIDSPSPEMAEASDQEQDYLSPEEMEDIHHG
jgi:hypothetical protein